MRLNNTGAGLYDASLMRSAANNWQISTSCFYLVE